MGQRIGAECFYMNFSLVIPLHNEEDNISELTNVVAKALDDIDIIEDYEIIFVDDGSSDGTYDLLVGLLPTKGQVVRFKKRYGQSAAIAAGLEKACYAVVGIMDGDMQTDARDFRVLLQKLAEGYYCVSGIKYPRKESWVKSLYVWLATRVRKSIFPDSIDDLSASMIIFYKNCIAPIFKFDSFHRYIPILIQMQGYKVLGFPVTTYKRKAGKSKYGFFNRFLGFFRSLYVLSWMRKNYISYELKN